MKVLLDMDGLLVDFTKGAFELHGLPSPYHKGMQHTYDIVSLSGMSAPEFWDPMNEEFWASLEMLPAAKDIVDILESYYGRENICLLTSPIRTPGCIRGKMRWIAEHLPQFTRQFLIGPAKEFCAHENSILFDDYEKNVERFEAAGGTGFLTPAPWNWKYKMDTFQVIVNYLKGEK